ncbi:hypothetical protein AAFC00_000951 [Neodothiora populina]|uniref:Ubiquitin carboxyl-terminal hydrolase n=1 Tax=Neodothiora populina TaxID=2781224 RepID=A0ABR3PMK7_9PEZI
MSFFGKLKGNATPASPSIGTAPAKKDSNALPPTPLERLLSEVSGPVRPDGSDKFFGFENYGSTCYCNSIIQCLYYSAPFRDKVINFPPLLDTTSHPFSPNEPVVSPGAQYGYLANGFMAPGPQAANSPARRPIISPNSLEAQTQKPDDKDSPEYKKKIAMQTGPVLDMQMNNSSTYGMEESLFTSLKDIFEAIIGHQSRTGVISPHKFLEILKKENEMFRSAMHQDAHEFLNLLLNSVVDNVEEYSKSNSSSPPRNGIQNGGADMNMADAMAHVAKANAAAGGSNNTAWVHDLFEGTLTSETRCLTCENTSQRDERFMDLSVDLEAHSSVTACLRKFSEEEMLCERNKFHCDNCGGLQEAEKRMKIKRLPRILALHLKRFKYTEDYGRLQKLFHRVVYPYHLRLFNTTDDAEDPDRLYELYAVVVHIGGGPYHGHYVSIIKTQDRGWLMFDDELVEPVSKEFVRNFFGGEPKTGAQDAKQLACAYVLFYQETTHEAVQKEMEAEGRAAAAKSHANAEPGSPTASGAYFGNGLRSTHTTDPLYEEKDPQFTKLAHASTAPALSAPRPPLSSTPSSPFMPPAASGKTAKKDEKLKVDKKADKLAEKERKAQAKELEKQNRTKQKEALDARRDRWKKQEDELKAAIEASKLTMAEEVSKHGAPSAPASPVVTSNGAADKPTGLNRFRHGSLSIRQKPKFWSSSGKELRETMGILPTPSEHTGDDTANGPPTGGPDKEIKKTRFSLGRKKSTML